MKHVLAFSLALVACGGGTQGTATSGSTPEPAAPSTPAPAPTTPPPSSDPAPLPYDIVKPAPAPPSVPACSAASVGPCVLFDQLESTNGDTGASAPCNHSAIDETFFYWDSFNGLSRVPKAGGARELVTGAAQGGYCFYGFAVDANAVYWPSADALVHVPKAGGMRTSLATGVTQPLAFAVDATHAYIAEKSQGRLVRAPLDGGAVTDFENGLECVAVALDDANVYCRSTGGVARLPKDRTLLVSNLADANGYKMLLFDSTVYVDDSQKLLRVSVAGGAAVPFIPTGAFNFAGLAAAEGALYVLDGFTTVRRMPLDGTTGATLPLDGGFSAVSGLTADSTGVYWVDTRTTCLREHVVPSPPSAGNNGVHKCVEGLLEVRVVRAPLGL